jgi:hypothetical protein
MPQQNFEQSKLEQSVAKVSEAMTKAARDAGAIPNDCRTECSISIGPDGKPVYTCRVVCDW